MTRWIPPTQCPKCLDHDLTCLASLTLGRKMQTVRKVWGEKVTALEDRITVLISTFLLKRSNYRHDPLPHTPNFQNGISQMPEPEDSPQCSTLEKDGWKLCMLVCWGVHTNNWLGCLNKASVGIQRRYCFFQYNLNPAVLMLSPTTTL